MLNRQYAKEYIKNTLGSPYAPFELSDEQLEFWLDYTLTNFSTYIPFRTYVTITRANKVDSNVFVIPWDGNILGVTDVYAPFENYAILGHPYTIMQTPAMETLAVWEQAMELYGIAKDQSYLNFTFEFRPPKFIIITPAAYDTYTLQIEVEHRPDLSTVKPEYIEIFLKMYFVNVANVIMNIRSTYRTISTPFGDIELNTDYIRDMIDRYRDELKEYFDSIPPQVYVVRN